MTDSVMAPIADDDDMDTSSDRLVIDLDGGTEINGADAATCSSNDTTTSDICNKQSLSPSVVTESNERMKMKKRKHSGNNRPSKHIHLSTNCLTIHESNDNNSQVRAELSKERTHKRKPKNDNSPLARTPKGSHSQKKMDKRDASTWVRTVSTSTDPESLGPCEPGSHVNLDGIVWSESPAGILVVNVTWRGKSYVGTLLDCTRYDWAPPRLCDSPPYEDGSKTPAKIGRNGKRTAANRVPHSASTSDLSVLKSKNSNNNAPKSKTPKLSVQVPTPSVSDEDSQDKTLTFGVSESLIEPLSPVLYDCPCKTCDKKYTEPVALKYHQNATHRKFAIKQNDDMEQPHPPVCSSPNRPVSGATLEDLASVASSLSPETENDGKLSQIESESLEKLFKVVDKGRRSSQPDLPKLEATAERATSRSPAYSDISDDGAPVLEKEVSDKLPPSSSDPIVTGTPNKEDIMQKSAQNSPKPRVLVTAKSNIQDEKSIDREKTPEQVCRTIKSETISPKPDGSSNIINVGHGIPLMAPGFINGQSPSNPVMPSGFPMGFMPPGFTPGPTPFGPGILLPMVSGPQISSGPHKIQELAHPSPPTKNIATSTQLAVQKEQHLKPVISSSAMTPSPPVQRHLHMHQHTHSFPPFAHMPLDPYAAYVANQQAQCMNFPPK